jgi:hypothetical protein
MRNPRRSHAPDAGPTGGAASPFWTRHGERSLAAELRRRVLAAEGLEDRGGAGQGDVGAPGEAEAQRPQPAAELAGDELLAVEGAAMRGSSPLL